MRDSIWRRKTVRRVVPRVGDGTWFFFEKKGQSMVFHACRREMITVRQIKNAAKYTGRHLSANDYYSEGESVTGYWHGIGAAMLGLEGEVLAEQLDLIGRCRHPETGEKLRPRKSKVELHDMVLSAPKAYSIAAIVGGDERLVEAFRESTKATLTELEKYAEVRDRQGGNYASEKTIRTGNVVAAVYQHDSSRLLDPQLHSHMEHANLSYCEERGGWFALQPKAMLEAADVVTFFRKDLAARAEKLGYEIAWRRNGSFGIKGISRALEEKFSTRTLQRRAFEQRYEKLFGQRPCKERVADFIRDNKREATDRFRKEYSARFGCDPSTDTVKEFVKDWRSSKLKQISTAEVRRRQRARLTVSEAAALDALVATAMETVTRELGLSERAVEDVVTAELVQTIPQRSWPDAGRWKEGAAQLVRAAKQKLGDLSERQRRSSAERKRSEERRLKREAEHRRRVRLSRTETLRRIKFGMQVRQAARGYPVALIAKNIRRMRR